MELGEDPATGDEALWLGETLIVITAFSGAPEMEQDRKIAEYGMACLLSCVITAENFDGRDKWFE